MKIDVAFPSMALAAYVEPLVEGRRVIVFGDSTSNLAELLIDRGARLVHVYDGDLARVSEATARASSKEITYAPLGQSGIATRDGAFDFGIIENVAAFGEGKKLVTRLRRALAARGVALVATPNLEAKTPLLRDPLAADQGPGYYELYDWVTAEFDEVRMLGQVPLAGYAVVDFGAEGEAEFSLDASFLPNGAEEPDWYLALVSHFPVSVDGFSVIQLPREGLLKAGSPTLDEPERADELSRKNAQLEAELERLRKAERLGRRSSDDEEQIEGLKRDVAEREATLRAHEQKLSDWIARAEEAERALSQHQRGAASSSKDTERARTESSQAKSDAERARAEALQAKTEAERLRDELTQAKAEATRTKAEATQAKAEATQAKSDTERARNELAKLYAPTEAERESAQLNELTTLERLLAERGKECARLAEELRLSEKLGAELMAELETLREASDAAAALAEAAELRERVERLARSEARRVADLHLAQWTIEDLRERLRGHELPGDAS